MMTERELQLLRLIDRHRADIRHLESISKHHPELFARVKARHRREIENILKEIKTLNENDKND